MELFHESMPQLLVSVTLRVRVRSPNESAKKARRAPLRMMDIFEGGVVAA